MDGLEDRVRRALGAGALAADPSLVDVDAVHAGVATRRRRRLAVASTAGVMALLAVGAVALNQQDNTKSSRVLTNPTASPTPDTRVPWLALPPPPAQTENPSPNPLTPARECTRDDVELASTSQDGAAGHLYTDVVVRNKATTACTLSDAPALSFAGTSTSGSVTHDHSTGPGGQTPATIKPQQVAHVTLDAQHGCPGAESTYRKIELILKDGYPIAIPDTLTATCPLVVSDWYVIPSEVGTDGADSMPQYLWVTASMEGAPLTVAPGTTLDHTVVLTNNGPDDVTLPKPCPAYREYITDGAHITDVTYGLNCAGWNGVIPSGGSVRLQMKLDIPAGLTTPVKFFWILESLPVKLLLTADGLHPAPAVGVATAEPATP